MATVHPFLSEADTEVLMHAFVLCQLDYRMPCSLRFETLEQPAREGQDYGDSSYF